MFPSNIQGLPTWFTVRANDEGWTARKRDADVFVAMNVESVDEDIASLRPGATLVITKSLASHVNRDRPHRPRRAVRRAGRPRLQGGQAPQDGGQHHVRRRPRPPARHRHGGGQARHRAPVRQEGDGRRAQHRGGGRRLRLGEGEPRQARPFTLRAERRRPRTRSSSRATRPPGSGLMFGGVHGARLVPDHPELEPVRVVHRLPRRVPPRPGDRQGDVRDDPGRGRARVDGDGRRRRLGGRARRDGDGGPGHLADVASSRASPTSPRSRRSSSTCSAWGRAPACPTRTCQGDMLQGLPPVARRLQAPAPHPGQPDRVLRVRRRVARPRRAAADAGVRDARPRPRDEQLDERSVPAHHEADRSRQGALRRGPRRSSAEFARYKDVDGDGIRYRTLPGTNHPHRRLLHARHRPHRGGDLLGEAEGLEEQHGPADAQVRHGAQAPAAPGRQARCRAPRSASSPSARATRRSRRRASRSSASTASTTDYLRLRALPIDDEVRDVHRRATGSSTSSSRTATRSAPRSCGSRCPEHAATRSRACCTTAGCPSTRRRVVERDPRRTSSEGERASHEHRSATRPEGPKAPPAKAAKRGRTASTSSSRSTRASSRRSAPAAATTRSPTRSSRACSSTASRRTRSPS